MTSPLPLEGIRVLELGNYMAGPFAGMLLADMGADVVKVENPKGGDYSRQLGPMPPGSPDGAGFLRLNRNKRSVALDLKSAAGKEAFRALARRADVLIENFRPGTLDDLTLGHAALASLNPRLIYVAVSGFGQGGDRRDRPGLDLIVQAESGLMSITGEEGGRPVKVGVPITDLTAALYAAFAATSALRLRERTDAGAFVDVAMLEAAVSLAVWESGVFYTTGEVPRPLGSAHIVDAPYQAFATADGHIVVGATSPPNWEAFCRVAGLERLLADEGLRSPAGRRERRRELAATIEQVTRTRTTDDWLATLSAAGIPCGRIRSYDEVFTDPGLAARGLFVDLPHPMLGTVRGVGSPLRFRDASPAHRTAGPLLGQHTREVLREAGIGEAQIDALVRVGAALEASVPAG